MYENIFILINEKEVIEGIVIVVFKKEVIINVGYKFEGVVFVLEFCYNVELKVGDKVDVFVEC